MIFQDLAKFVSMFQALYFKKTNHQREILMFCVLPHLGCYHSLPYGVIRDLFTILNSSPKNLCILFNIRRCGWRKLTNRRESLESKRQCIKQHMDIVEASIQRYGEAQRMKLAILFSSLMAFNFCGLFLLLFCPLHNILPGTEKVLMDMY